MPHDDPTKAFDDSSGGGGSTTADQEEDDDPFGSGFELDDDDTITSDGDPVDPDDDTDDQRRDDDDDDDGGATGVGGDDPFGSGFELEDDDTITSDGDPVEPSGGDESPPGEGEEVDATAGTDPDAGDDSRRVLRDDAESDPMNPQTERVAGTTTPQDTRPTDGRRASQGQAPGRRRRRRRRDRRERDSDPFGTGFTLDDEGTIRSDGEPVDPADDDAGGDQTSDVSGEEVVAVAASNVLESLNEQFGDAYEIELDQVTPDRFAVELTSDDFYDRSGVVEFDRGELRSDLEAREARVERNTGRDVDLQVNEAGKLEVTYKDPEESRVVEEEGRLADRSTPAERAAREVERQLEAQIGRQRARRGGFGELFVAPAGVSGTEEGGRRLTEEMAREFADLERGRDFTVDIEETPEGLRVQAELTETFRETESRRAAAAEVERATGVPVDPEADLQVDESGRVTLTEEASGEVARQAAREERFGDAPIREIPISGAALFTDEVAGVPTSIRVSDLPGIEGEDTRVEDPLRSSMARYDEFVRDFTQPIEQAEEGDVVLDTAIDDILIAAGVSEETAETVERYERAGVRTALQFGNLPALALGAKEGAEFVDYQAGELAAGRAINDVSPRARVDTLVVDPLDEEPETIEVDVGLFEGGSFGRAEEAAGTAVERFGDMARERPAETAGALSGGLLGSAAIMTGAAAVSSRAGLASRVAIQPGEEILGYGGNLATRVVAGERTAERLFPNNEPLIFSEEAAIRTARRGGARARQLGGRLRKEIGRTELNVRSRQGLGAGGLSIELERGELEEPGQIDADDIADPLGDPRPGRLADPSRTDLTEFQRRKRRRRLYEETERPPDIVERGILERRQRRIAEAEQERGRDVSRRRLESAIGIEPLAMEGLGIGGRSAVDPMSETAARSVAEVRTEPDPIEGLELDLELAAEQEFDPILDLESEFELEPITELELETELDLETELEAEVEPREGPPILPDRRRRGRPPGWVRRIERDLINPFLGE